MVANTPQAVNRGQPCRRRTRHAGTARDELPHELRTRLVLDRMPLSRAGHSTKNAIASQRESCPMKIAYLDCASGISGDMTLGRPGRRRRRSGRHQSGHRVAWASPAAAGGQHEVKKKGFRATQITVEHEPEHKHRHLHHITAMIDGSTLTARQKDLANRIFRRLAEAEAKVHGSDDREGPLSRSRRRRFDRRHRRRGDRLRPARRRANRLLARADRQRLRRNRPRPLLHSGARNGRTAQGRPAGRIARAGELTTPTGAAIVATLVDVVRPAARHDHRAHRLRRRPKRSGRASQHAAAARRRGSATTRTPTNNSWVLETNLDDITGELIGHAVDAALGGRRARCLTTAIQMKKNRPGVMLSVLCRAEHDRGDSKRSCFAKRTTLGVRRWHGRTPTSCAAKRSTVETPWGPVEGKVAWLADGSPRFSPEYESCRRVAEQHGVPLRAVYEAAQQAYRRRRRYRNGDASRAGRGQARAI